jgi:5-carboxymethyl-2-hydroxymuconate isomerase
MPHISIAVSPGLAGRMDWARILPPLHRALAERGFAAIDDLKSRVQLCDYTLLGDDEAAQQIVATLHMTNPRADETQRAMAQLILAHLEQAVTTADLGCWTQCCVFCAFTPKSHYLRRDLFAERAAAG